MTTSLSVLVLPGDHIGPEITAATVTVVEAAIGRFGLPIQLSSRDIGFKALERDGITINDDTIAAAKAADGVILGPISHNDYPPREEGGINPSAALRKGLDLYANIRPARSREGLPTPIGRPVDLVIYRENTEGFYADRTMFWGSGEFMPTEDVALAVRKITRQGSRRIARAAADFAAAKGLKLTAIHKKNVLRASDGLFLEECRAAVAAHPGLEYEEMLVDAAAAHLIRNPDRFGVIVTTNMFGDILSDQATEMAGGLGLAASLNAGDDFAVAQAQHGSAPDIAGQDKANPSSLIASTAMLFDWMAGRPNAGDAADKLREAAKAIDTALDACLADPATRTADLGGPLGTEAFAQAVAAKLKS